MFQRWTVSGQRLAGLINGILIGVGIMMFAVGGLYQGLGIIIVTGGLELWQRSLSKKQPDSIWKWDTTR